MVKSYAGLHRNGVEVWIKNHTITIRILQEQAVDYVPHNNWTKTVKAKLS